MLPDGTELSAPFPTLRCTQLTRPSNRDEQCFIWKTEDGASLFYDNHETVRFRVESEEWNDQQPIGPNNKIDETRQSPYKIIASMEDPGLGPCLWWDEDEDMQAEA
jgi:DNA-directed RNA polymerase III subunit RPC8